MCQEWIKRGYKVTVLTGIPNYPMCSVVVKCNVCVFVCLFKETTNNRNLMDKFCVGKWKLLLLYDSFNDFLSHFYSSSIYAHY